MGYEVLDVGGADPRAADQLRRLAGTVEVHDLDSLPRAGREGPGGRGPTRRTAALVAVTVIAATVGAGAYWSGHRTTEPPPVASGNRPRVLAIAQPATLAMIGPATAATLRISVVNVGRVPVQVVVSPAQVRPVQGATLVGLADGGSPQIAPGDARQLVAVVGLSCVSSTLVTPRLSVRGPDGHPQAVVVRDANLDTYRVNAQAICGTPNGSTLTAQLAGSVRDPLLVVRNASDHDVAVIVDPHSPVPQTPDRSGAVPPSIAGGVIVPPVELSTVPRLPVLLPARTDITLTLDVHLRGCLPLAALNMQGYLQLLGVPVVRRDGAHEVPETSSTTVDLTALLGSQLASTCA